jgi:hypothetical protein
MPAQLAHLCGFPSRFPAGCRETGGSARLETRKVAGTKGKCVRKAGKPGEVRAHLCRFRVTDGKSWLVQGAGARILGTKRQEVRERRAHVPLSCQRDGRKPYPCARGARTCAPFAPRGMDGTRCKCASATHIGQLLASGADGTGGMCAAAVATSRGRQAMSFERQVRPGEASRFRKEG